MVSLGSWPSGGLQKHPWEGEVGPASPASLLLSGTAKPWDGLAGGGGGWEGLHILTLESGASLFQGGCLALLQKKQAWEEFLAFRGLMGACALLQRWPPWDKGRLTGMGDSDFGFPWADPSYHVASQSSATSSRAPVHRRGASPPA